MTSESSPFEVATTMVNVNASAANAVGKAVDATSCSSLDLSTTAQRRVNGSTSSFSLEEEEDDVNDVYSSPPSSKKAKVSSTSLDLETPSSPVSSSTSSINLLPSSNAPSNGSSPTTHVKHSHLQQQQQQHNGN